MIGTIKVMKMKDTDKTKEQLINEVEGLRQQIAALEEREETLKGKVYKTIIEFQGIFLDGFYSPYKDSKGDVIGTIGMAVDITERERREVEREKLLHDMGERVKELSCMYGVANSLRTQDTLEAIFQDVVALIPPGWHYPEITRGKVCFDGKEYVLEPFEETGWRQTSDIIVAGRRRGTVEVYYLEERPLLGEGPFLKEERHLIDGIAQALSEAIDHKLAEEQLKASLKEKEILLQEIHHRVKNNMMVISSLLNIQASVLEDPKMIDILREARDRIRTMAIVHERVYQSQNMASVDFNNYVTAIANNLLRVSNIKAGKIQLDFDIRDISIEIQRAIPCGLIINELLTNAIKYAFLNEVDQKGRITVVMYLTDSKQVHLMVRDNGCGIPEGIDVSTTKSMGLRLVHMMVKQLKGKLEINRKKGTEFKITFPL